MWQMLTEEKTFYYGELHGVYVPGKKKDGYVHTCMRRACVGSFTRIKQVRMLSYYVRLLYLYNTSTRKHKQQTNLHMHIGQT